MHQFQIFALLFAYESFFPKGAQTILYTIIRKLSSYLIVILQQRIIKSVILMNS